MDNRFYHLENSVMFNLSLSSKELFHSNLLAYLFKKDNTLFCKIIGVAPFQFEIKKEYKNIDIEIVGKNKKYLIENKVKDIIGNEQLEKIENSCKKGEYEKLYLFSLLGNNLETIGINNELWCEIGYEKIVDILNKHNFNDSYINALKIDYCNFVLILISLIKEQYINCNNYILYYKNDIVKNFKKVKLHDVFMKYGMSHFLNYFKSTVKNDIKYKSSINRGKGTMQFFQKINDIEYGIETEDLDYRRYIIGDIKSRDYFENIGWFDKNWKSASGKNYLKYESEKYGKDKIFWYQNGFKNRNMENINYNDLVDYIKNDINIVCKNSPNFV